MRSRRARGRTNQACDAGVSGVVLNRETLEVLGSIGSQGSQLGQFQNIHHIAVDSNGTLYTAEVAPGRRFQKFVRTSASTR